VSDVRACKAKEGFDLLRKVDLARLQQAKKREQELMKQHWFDQANEAGDRLAKSFTSDDPLAAAADAKKAPARAAEDDFSDSDSDEAKSSSDKAKSSKAAASKTDAAKAAKAEAADDKAKLDEELFAFGPQGLIDTILMPERGDKDLQNYLRTRTVQESDENVLPRLIKPECALRWFCNRDHVLALDRC